MNLWNSLPQMVLEDTTVGFEGRDQKVLDYEGHENRVEGKK